MATVVPITNKCNQNCLFCAAKNRKDNIQWGYLINSINKATDLVVISGGEPTLSEDLFKILKYVKKKRLRIELQTNGVTSSYFNLSKRLVGEEIDLFNVNFPCHIESLNDKITQTKGFFEKRIEGIKNLQKLGANVRLTHIVNSLTYRKVDKYVAFVANNFPKVRYIQFSFIKILGGARKNIDLVPKYDAVKTSLLKGLKECKKNNIDFFVDHIPTCYLTGFEDHHVDFLKLKSGQSSEFSLKEKIKLQPCRKCKLEKFCYGVREDYLKLYGEKSISLKPRY